MENSELDYLHVGKNLIGNSGMKLITDGLQKNKTLIQLKVYDCGFSVEGMAIHTGLLICCR